MDSEFRQDRATDRNFNQEAETARRYPAAA